MTGNAGDRADALAAFVEQARSAIGDDLVGVVSPKSSDRVGFVTMEPYGGDDRQYRYTEPIREAARSAGLRAQVMPFNVDGRMVYEAAVRTRA